MVKPINKFHILLLLCIFCHDGMANALSFKEKLVAHYQHVPKLTKLYYKVKFVSPAPTQSYDFRSPTNIVNHYAIEIDLDRHQFYQHFKRQNPGNFVFENISVIDGDNAFKYDVNGFVSGKVLQKYQSSIKEEYQAMSGHISTLAIAQLLFTGNKKITELIVEDKVSLSYLNKDQHKVSYLFDKQSLELLSITDESKKSHLIFSKPSPIGNLTFAQQVETYIDGKQRNTIYISVFHTITRIDEKKLRSPADYHFNQDKTNEAPKLVKLNEQLYLMENIAKDRNVLIYQHGDGLTIFGAPSNDNVSQQVITAVQSLLPNKSITHVYVSHAHGDHIAGLSAYANMGATIIADEYTIEAIKHFDKFKNNIDHFNFKEISHNEIFQDVTYFVLENTHVRKQSFVLFPQHKLIYQGDFLEIPNDNSIASHISDVEKTFIEYLYKQQIQFERIVGHHRNSNIKPAIVDAYYQYNTR